MSVKMSSDTTLALSDLNVVVGCDFLNNEVKTKERQEELSRIVREPVLLTTPAKDKKQKLFDMPSSLFDVDFKLNKEDGLMVVSLSFTEEGWDEFSYSFLQMMASEVQKKPKNFARSYRAYANLMRKLTPKPIGSGKNDVPRKIVIDKTTEQMAPMIREILSDRIKNNLLSNNNTK